MASRYLKKCSLPSSLREMQMRSAFRAVRWLCRQRCLQAMTPEFHCWETWWKEGTDSFTLPSDLLMMGARVCVKCEDRNGMESGNEIYMNTEEGGGKGGVG